jgi:hypothetical protein
MADEQNSRRSASDVLWRHLELAEQGTVDDDLAENFAPDVVVLTRWGSFVGHDGIKELADRLADELPDVEFEYDVVLVERDFGFLAWRATASNGNRVDDGADSYVIRDGRIVAQSIHYTLQTHEAPT